MLHIPYDEAFCAKTVARQRAFYLGDMFPFVSDEYNEGRLLLRVLDAVMQMITLYYLST